MSSQTEQRQPGPPVFDRAAFEQAMALAILVAASVGVGDATGGHHHGAALRAHLMRFVSDQRRGPVHAPADQPEAVAAPHAEDAQRLQDQWLTAMPGLKLIGYTCEEGGCGRIHDEYQPDGCMTAVYVLTAQPETGADPPLPAPSYAIGKDKYRMEFWDEHEMLAMYRLGRQHEAESRKEP